MQNKILKTRTGQKGQIGSNHVNVPKIQAADMDLKDNIKPLNVPKTRK